jgi:hypothetical protein
VQTATTPVTVLADIYTFQAIHRGNQVHANAILAMHPNVIGSQRSATRQAGFLVHLAIFVGCHQAERAA